MKIAVIGAKGMLGREFCRDLAAHHEILAWDIDEIDITDRARTLELLNAERPELIINSAAYVDLEGCEAKPDMAWCVNDINDMVLPMSGDRRRDNRDAPLSFLCHPIRDRRSVINRTKTMRPAGVKQHPFGRGRLTSINMRDDANITVAV